MPWKQRNQLNVKVFVKPFRLACSLQQPDCPTGCPSFNARRISMKTEIIAMHALLGLALIALLACLAEVLF